VNTDAEGRVILSDSLAYAVEQNPDAIIDLATLTGACVVALGYHASGAIGNDEGLISLIRQAGDVAGERVWPLPLWKEHRRDIDSPIADIKNTGIRYGGAITAALFLREFVRQGLRWAHMDIAGPAFGDKEYSYIKRGGTGFGVRTLIRYLQDASA